MYTKSSIQNAPNKCFEPTQNFPRRSRHLKLTREVSDANRDVHKTPVVDGRRPRRAPAAEHRGIGSRSAAHLGGRAGSKPPSAISWLVWRRRRTLPWYVHFFRSQTSIWHSRHRLATHLEVLGVTHEVVEAEVSAFIGHARPAKGNDGSRIGRLPRVSE